jgi:hypothetical protein
MMYPWFRLRRRMMMSAGSLDIASLAITYTGTYTDYGVVTMTDGDYRLLAMTGSGTLTIAKPVNCEVCVVGGGSNSANTGGAGAYLTNQSLTAFAGSAVVVGAANGASSIGDVAVAALSAKSKNGGSGGGAYYTTAAGTGDGLSKYPFGDTAYSLWAGKPHCGGGGGTGKYEADSDTGGYACYNGGDGGSNGGNGGEQTVKYMTIKTYYGGAGGAYGGGSGVSKSRNGSSATYYGGGAGGGSSAFSGYQGIVYLRIPTKQ